MSRCRTLPVLIMLLCACGAPEVKPDPPPAPEPIPKQIDRHKMVNPLEAGPEAGKTRIKTWGVMGTIDRKVTEKGLAVQFPAVVQCFERQVKKEPYLGGRMKLSFRLDQAGKVKQLFLIESDIGSMAVERCVVEELTRTAFPPPRGGETEFTFPLSFAGNMESQWWSPRKVERKFRKIERDLDPGLPSRLSLTFYVNRRGRVVSVGMCAEAPIDAARADELEKKVRRLRFRRHRARYVKVSYPLNWE